MPLLLFFNYPIKTYLFVRDRKTEKLPDYTKNQVRFFVVSMFFAKFEH